jgi:hypothetical protein
MPGGRPVGSKNMLTQDIRNRFRMFVVDNLPEIQKWMDQVAKKDPAKALEYILGFSEYCLPKLARIEHTGENGKDLIIKIVGYGSNGSEKLLSTSIPVAVVESVGQRDEKSDSIVAS